MWPFRTRTKAVQRSLMRALIELDNACADNRTFVLENQRRVNTFTALCRVGFAESLSIVASFRSYRITDAGRNAIVEHSERILADDDPPQKSVGTVGTQRAASNSPRPEGEGSGVRANSQPHNRIVSVAPLPAIPAAPSFSPSLNSERAPAGEVSPRPEGEGPGVRANQDCPPDCPYRAVVDILITRYGLHELRGLVVDLANLQQRIKQRSSPRPEGEGPGGEG